MIERVDAAQTLANRIIQMVRSTSSAPRLQAAWRLLTGVLNEVVSYDLCVLPPAVTALHADRLDALVLQVAGAILGGDALREPRLLRLDRAHGGCAATTL